MKRSYPDAIHRSRGSRIAVSCFYPLSCYPETTDSRGLSEEGSLVPQVGWGRPQVYVRLRRSGVSRGRARRNISGREEGRERKSRGNDDAEVEKLPLGEGIGQEQASGRQIKRSDGV